MTTIRPGKPSDVDALRTIQSLALDEPWPDLLETALDGGIPIVVAVAQAPIGYAIAIPGSDGDVYVPELAVHPERQGEGNGSELLSHLCDRFRKEDRLLVTVQASDERARRFYRRHGFEQTERLPGHFESGDGVLLARDTDYCDSLPP